MLKSRRQQERNMLDKKTIQENDRQWTTISDNIKLLFEQNELLKLLNDNGINPIVIGDSAAAIYYPDPLKRKLEEIDFIVKGNDFSNAGQLCSAAGYTSFTLPEDQGNCLHYVRNNITIHIHKQIELFVEEENNNLLNQWIAEGVIEKANIGKYSIPVLPYWINGLLQLGILKTAIGRKVVRKSQIDDWTMFVKSNLPDAQWNSFHEKTEQVGLTETAKRASRAAKDITGLDITWCDEVPNDLKRYIYDDQQEVNKGEEVTPQKRSWRRVVYDIMRHPPFRIMFYHLQDFYFVLTHKLMGKARIQPEDIENVEKHVTFIYKSFNRQKQAKRLYKNIKSYYPNVRIIVADDSRLPLDLPDVIHLPFNSGLSKGLAAALEQVETPYVIRLDDDMLLTPHTDIHEELKFLMKHPEADLVAVMSDHKRPGECAKRFADIRTDKKLMVLPGTNIDGRIVTFKAPNSFLARTDKMKMIGYDPNIRMEDHHDFFYRAAGQIVSVLDPEAYIIHCHNLFEREDYNQYRNDVMEDHLYRDNKHISKYQH